ncbi:hypothetical protein B0H17DRAFT_1138159 [Mycena rosella]|uniref:Uncharacterized protein n=1 Tax=Mycena rosella TaxID=1033263 RepID=A0AAD7D7P8_MYCRO|nr:hypothetical protein B0H17DRAFT_1138159 [Mycena rosella]
MFNGAEQTKDTREINELLGRTSPWERHDGIWAPKSGIRPEVFPGNLGVRKNEVPRSGNTAGIPQSFNSTSSQLSVPNKDLPHASSLSSTISPPLFTSVFPLAGGGDPAPRRRRRARGAGASREGAARGQELQLAIQLSQEAYRQPPAQLSQDDDEILSIWVPYGRVNTEEIYGIVWPTHQRHGSADRTAIIPRSTSILIILHFPPLFFLKGKVLFGNGILGSLLLSDPAMPRNVKRRRSSKGPALRRQESWCVDGPEWRVYGLPLAHSMGPAQTPWIEYNGYAPAGVDKGHTRHSASCSTRQGPCRVGGRG